MLPQLIQRQVPIGSQVKFSLKSGREISGILVEIGRDHITVQRDGGSTTVLVDMIGGWEVLESAPPAPDERPAGLPDARETSTTDQRILRVPMGISEQALSSQTFSLPLYAQYRTRSGEGLADRRGARISIS